MNKVFLGEIEVANTGGGGGGDYVLNSSFDELSRVAATALLDLKESTDNIVENVSIFSDKISDDISVLNSEVTTLDNNKPDVSTVYTKSEIDMADKVAAAAIASLDGRVSELEQGGGGGGGITPQQLDASLKEYTYDKAWIDASIGAIEPGISYNQLDASLREYTYDKAHLDASFGRVDASIVALDASALSFDASIKELAQGGGGGGGGITPAQLDASLKEYTYNKAYIDSSFNACATDNDISTFKPIVYTTKDDYDEDVSEGTIDPDTMYVITDIASTDELSNMVTIDDLNAEKARINASLNETGDAVITAANSSMNYWSTQNVSQCQSQCNSAKNTAVSAVQSQQTTSVNAVNTAKTTALDDISTAMAQMKDFEVMTEA